MTHYIVDLSTEHKFELFSKTANTSTLFLCFQMKQTFERHFHFCLFHLVQVVWIHPQMGLVHTLCKSPGKGKPQIQRYSLIIWTYDDDGPRSLGTWVWILWLCHRMIRGHWLDFSGSQLFICYLDEMTLWPMSPLDDDDDYFLEHPWLGKVSLHRCHNYDQFIWFQKGPELSHSPLSLALSCKTKINLYFVTVSPGQELVSQSAESLLFLKCV